MLLPRFVCTGFLRSLTLTPGQDFHPTFPPTHSIVFHCPSLPLDHVDQHIVLASSQFDNTTPGSGVCYFLNTEYKAKFFNNQSQISIRHVVKDQDLSCSIAAVKSISFIKSKICSVNLFFQISSHCTNFNLQEKFEIGHVS